MPRRKAHLLDRLEEAGFLNEEQRRKADEQLLHTKKPLADILVELGLCTRAEAAEVMELIYNTPFVKLSEYILNPDAVKAIPESVARKHKLIPVDISDTTITVAMLDPQDINALDDVKAVSNRRIVPLVAEPDEIDKAISEYYRTVDSVFESTVEQLGASAEVEEVEPLSETEDLEQIEIKDLRLMGKQPPVVEMVNQIILRAVRAEASDIHIEPVRNGLLVRFRVDGILQDSVRIPKNVRPAVTSRIKILSRMDIAERRLPQDGRFQAIVEGARIDFRVSTLPGIMGEKVVIRLLDLTSGITKLSELGMGESEYESLISMIRKTTGILIITGPTGSGKTTTLYSILDIIKSAEKNIITVEDPVEYRLDRVYQVQVNSKIGLDFANVLRSVLRQDPDIIMVGEIRDTETSELAVRAALTGHLVLSTLHTSSAASALTRLRDLGLNPFLIGATINGIVSQRLVRKLCPECKRVTGVSDKTIEVLGEEGEVLRGQTVYEAVGCSKCSQRGYAGRTAVFEILPLASPLMRDLILLDRPASEIYEMARQELGMCTLQESGCQKALAGITSLEEILRVTL
ncbi:MAG: GspE/PulE family protein [Planctomycetota bacterium]